MKSVIADIQEKIAEMEDMESELFYCMCFLCHRGTNVEDLGLNVVG